MEKNTEKPKDKKTVSGLRDPEVVSWIKDIRVRSRGAFLESAVKYYMRSREGKRMFDVLKKDFQDSPSLSLEK